MTNTDQLRKLTEQFILLFYGTEALQEYRADNDLVPITVYQAVRLHEQYTATAVRAARQDDLINFLDNPETINKAVEGSMDKRLQTTDDTDTNVAMTSPTIDMELDGILDTLFVQGESFTSKHIDAKEAIKALIQSENLRVTLELMEKHHIPLQTHTLDGTSPHERSDTK